MGRKASVFRQIESFAVALNAMSQSVSAACVDVKNGEFMYSV